MQMKDELSDFLVCLLRATPVSYGGSQARGQIRATAASLCHSRQPVPQPQQHGIQAASVTYVIAYGSTRSLTHRARPGIKPTSSWILVRFVTTEPQWELPSCQIFKTNEWWVNYVSEAQSRGQALLAPDTQSRLGPQVTPESLGFCFIHTHTHARMHT